MTDPAAPALLLGPLLRYVDTHRATIWVETDRPCEVRVRVPGVEERSERTWTVHGHHFALVCLDDLSEGSEHAYEVLLDGGPVWPEAGSAFPPSVIRTFRHDESFRLSFGSCRRSAPMDAEHLKEVGADALVALANRMMAGDHERWPDALYLAGDQVYADIPSPQQRARLLSQHGVDDEDDLDPDDPMTEVAAEIQNFEEYTWLYHDSWMEPTVRWLLSTVPTAMILDDHDLRDDWNTSQEWRDRVTRTPWWRERAVGAFGSYWVYQHLGNLSPDELARDRLYAMVRETADDDERTRLLDEFAWDADARPDSTRWSFVRDFASGDHQIRLVVVDSRCSRVLDPQRRAMVDDAEWDWFSKQVLPDDGTVLDHLMIGSTLPVLLLPGIHHLEGWDEALARGRWGRWGQRFAEWLRQTVDLEHWSAFRTSFHRLMDLIARVGRQETPPSSVLLLSGDVHCSYTANARLDGIDPARTGFHQLVMSPFRNPLEPPIRIANHLLNMLPVRALLHWLARRAGVEDAAVDWEVDHGMWFDNGVMTVVFHGGRAAVEVDHAHVRGGEQVLQRTHSQVLTPTG
jgi:hypothetical protein